MRSQYFIGYGFYVILLVLAAFNILSAIKVWGSWHLVLVHTLLVGLLTWRAIGVMQKIEEMKKQDRYKIIDDHFNDYEK